MRGVKFQLIDVAQFTVLNTKNQVAKYKNWKIRASLFVHLFICQKFVQKLKKKFALKSTGPKLFLFCFEIYFIV